MPTVDPTKVDVKHVSVGGSFEITCNSSLDQPVSYTWTKLPSGKLPSSKLNNDNLNKDDTYSDKPPIHVFPLSLSLIIIYRGSISR